MPVTQVTVFLENRSGRLAEVADVLGKAGITIDGFSTTEAAEYSIVRLLVADPKRAGEVLDAAGFTTHLSRVLCIRVPDEAGSLARVLNVLAEEGIAVDHLYSVSTVHVCVATRDLDRAVGVLGDKLELLDDDELTAS